EGGRSLSYGFVGLSSPLQKGPIMSGRTVVLVKTVLLAAALLLTAPPVLAGPAYRAGNRTTTPSQPAAAPVARAAVTLAVVVESTQPVREPLYVDLRGPDGLVRRFPVEGGREAIRTQPAVVLSPGQSLTILMRPAK